jgi:hypothetical protein
VAKTFHFRYIVIHGDFFDFANRKSIEHGRIKIFGSVRTIKNDNGGPLSFFQLFAVMDRACNKSRALIILTIFTIFYRALTIFLVLKDRTEGRYARAFRALPIIRP